MKRINKFLLCLMALLGVSMISKAQQISLDEALTVARDCMSSNVSKAKGRFVSSEMKLAHKAVKNGNVCYYVFNNGQNDGFVIVGGDERANKILAIVPEGSFNFNEMPENMKAWLEEYEIQIDRAIRLTPEVTKQEKAQRQARRAAKARKTDIAEMITTKWGQRQPYSDAIMTQSGLSAGTHGRPFLTGCVATAMAQVMKFWNYPTTGTGFNSVYNYKLRDAFVADFEHTTYDWANMKDDYRYGYTDEEVNAVATLMFHCGVACEMNFNDDASGAGLPSAATGLRRYFGYSNSVYPLSKYMVSEEEFVDAVYNELKEGRPIIYAGGVHAFVCHGYDAANDLYAINWGWYGTADGYFAITGDDALTPNVVGDGGDAEGYGNGQQIICGVKPRLNDPMEDENMAPLAIANNIGWQIQKNRYIYPSYNEFDLSEGDQNLTFYAELSNLTGVAKDVELCVVFEDEATGERIYTDVIQDTFWPEQKEYIFSTNFSTSIFQNSSLYCPYLMVRPANQPEAEWTRTLFAYDQELVKFNITGRGEQHTMPLAMELVDSYGSVYVDWDWHYQGSYTVTSSDEDIIRPDYGNYLRKGTKVGTAEITVVAEADGIYGKTVKTFTYTNTDAYLDNTYGYYFLVKDIVAPNPEYVTWGYRWSGVNSTMTTEGGKVKFTIKKTDWMAPEDVDVHFVIKNRSSEWDWENQLYPEYTYLESFHVTGWPATSDRDSETFTIDLTKYAPLYEGSLHITPCFSYSGDAENGYQANDDIGGLWFGADIAPTLEIPYTLSAAGWGTVCLPYATEIPAGLDAYICSGESNGTLILESVNTMQEKTPYITSGTPGDYTFRGPQIDEYNLEDTYNRGMLTGVMKTGVQIPENAYLLQKKNDVVAFYRYVGDAANATQYRAFLNGNKLSNSARAACYMPGTNRPTDVESVVAAPATMPAGIYDMQGHRINQLQKGFNILLMEDGSVKKVMVK